MGFNSGLLMMVLQLMMLDIIGDHLKNMSLFLAISQIVFYSLGFLVHISIQYAFYIIGGEGIIAIINIIWVIRKNNTQEDFSTSFLTISE